MKPLVGTRVPRILVVDDQEDHTVLMQKALERQDPAPEVFVATDGLSALEMMREHKPDLVLLDLNMPGMTGQEVLQAIREDDELHTIPVSILSTSAHRKDVEACFALHANAYLQKPAGFRALVDTMQSVTDHWFRYTILPSGPD